MAKKIEETVLESIDYEKTDFGISPIVNNEYAYTLEPKRPGRRWR